MFSIAEDILGKTGIEFSILLPLIQQTIKQLNKNKAKNVQTGPARRKDTSIIQDHLTNIQDKKIMYLAQEVEKQWLNMEQIALVTGAEKYCTEKPSKRL